MTYLDNFNLIGDALYAIRPIDRFLESHEDVSIRIENNLAGEVQRKHFAGRAACINEIPEGKPRIKLDCGKAFGWCMQRHGHISHGYAVQLGVPNDGPTIPDSWAEGWDGYEGMQDVVAIAPFSVSGMHNKAFLREEFESIAERTSQTGLKPLLLGLFNYPQPVDVEVRAARDLEDFTRLVRGVKMLITCDNGVSHLASALGIRTVVYWKRCVPESWIAPSWGKQTTLAYSVEEILKTI